jgi:hypothetical protein
VGGRRWAGNAAIGLPKPDAEAKEKPGDAPPTLVVAPPTLAGGATTDTDRVGTAAALELAVPVLGTGAVKESLKKSIDMASRAKRASWADMAMGVGAKVTDGPVLDRGTAEEVVLVVTAEVVTAEAVMVEEEDVEEEEKEEEEEEEEATNIPCEEDVMATIG